MISLRNSINTEPLPRVVLNPGKNYQRDTGSFLRNNSEDVFLTKSMLPLAWFKLYYCDGGVESMQRRLGRESILLEGSVPRTKE